MSLQQLHQTKFAEITSLIVMLTSQATLIAAKLPATTCHRGVIPFVCDAAAVTPGAAPSPPSVETCTSAIVYPHVPDWRTAQAAGPERVSLVI